MNKDEVLEMNGKEDIRALNGITDKEDGIRFEGRVFEGIPCGLGTLFDENGNRIYEGMVINWIRMGYGTSYNENGTKEFEGYWCNDTRFGYGSLFDLDYSLIYEGYWCNRNQTYGYVGDGNSLPIKVKHLELTDSCILNNFDVDLFILLEELIIGNDCYGNVDIFRIDGLTHLKSIKIGKDSFSNMNNSCDSNGSTHVSRSFHVLNCTQLESIEIGPNSFSDYADGFELKNLPSLLSIKIGEIESWSHNFFDSSFVIENLPNLESIELGNDSFSRALTTVISNLPNLKSIKLGKYGLVGKRDDDSCSLVMKYLPKLESITSVGESFREPRSVTLYNIPNLKTADVPDSFYYVIYTDIEYVSNVVIPLLPQCYHYDYIESIDSASVCIRLPDRVCNDFDYTVFDFSRFSLLTELIIGSNSFYSVDTFMINEMIQLKYIKIEMNSFTRNCSENDNPNRSFHVLNCHNLQSIEIGPYSFSDYGGEFELKNLPSLSKIKIGEIGSGSLNFAYASFIVEDLPNLQLIELGEYAFNYSLLTKISELPNLKSIKLGYGAIAGRYDCICSLLLNNLPKLESFTAGRFCFMYPRLVTLSDIPSLKTVSLPNAFQYVQSKSVSNVSPNLSDLVVINN